MASTPWSESTTKGEDVIGTHVTDIFASARAVMETDKSKRTSKNALTRFVHIKTPRFAKDILHFNSNFYP